MTFIGAFMMILTGFDLLDGKESTPNYVIFGVGVLLVVVDRFVTAFGKGEES